MKVRVERHDDELILRIPSSMTAQFDIAEGTEAEATTVHGDLVLRFPRRRLRLEDLLDAVTPDNVHGEIDFGPPVGREAW